LPAACRPADSFRSKVRGISAAKKNNIPEAGKMAPEAEQKTIKKNEVSPFYRPVEATSRRETWLRY